MTDLETIKELLARATKGEWYIRNPHSGDVRILASGDRDKTPAATICQMANWLDHELRERDANAALIALAPELIEARAEIERLRDMAKMATPDEHRMELYRMKNEALTAERDRLRDALRKYGRHVERCGVVGECVCGLDAALGKEG